MVRGQHQGQAEVRFRVACAHVQHASPGHGLYVPGAHGRYAPPDHVFWLLPAPPQLAPQPAAPPPQHRSAPQTQPPVVSVDPVGSRPQTGAARKQQRRGDVMRCSCQSGHGSMYVTRAAVPVGWCPCDWSLAVVGWVDATRLPEQKDNCVSHVGRADAQRGRDWSPGYVALVACTALSP